MEAVDHVTELRVRGMRGLADVRLPLRGLTVLIGDNGTGKTTLLEALDVACQATGPGGLSASLLSFHNGLPALLRAGEEVLRIGVRIEGAGPPIDYSFGLRRQGGGTVVTEETLDVWETPDAAEPLRIIQRDAASCRVFDVQQKTLQPFGAQQSQLTVTAFGNVAQPPIARVIETLGRGRIHVPFNVRPQWIDGVLSPLRRPATVGRAAELDRLGGNLANCFHVLANDASVGDWQRILDRVRAGMPDILDLKTPPAGRGEIELVAYLRGMPAPIPVAALSDGELTYLAFVALTEMAKGYSFLGFDEPEQHLHPELLVRVTWMLEELADSCPVVISTHSDRLLDALTSPASSVVLCELDDHRATRLLRPDPVALAQWLERYRGIGDLRAAGFGKHVLTKTPSSS